MSDTIVLRKVYALDSNTGLFLSTGQVLFTNGLGGTNWVDMLSTLTIAGGPIMNNVPSTISSYSTVIYTNTSTMSTSTYELTRAVCSIGAIANATGASIVVANLGTVGYVSTATMSTYVGEAMSTFTTSPSTISTLVPSLSTFQYANSSTISTLDGSIRASSISTVSGLSNLGYIITRQLASTIDGLGQVGYISTIATPMSLQSTVTGLGSVGYISSSTLLNTINTMGNIYVSTTSLTSTVGGLSTFGYPTNIDLSTAILGISAAKNSIRFDTVGNVILSGSSNLITFTNTSAVIYVSTFYQSSMIYSGAPVGSTIVGRLLNTNDMEFSTATIRLDAFSSFINNNSRVTLDIYPTYVFTKLGTGATKPVVVAMSTLLKSGNTVLLNTAVTNSLFVGNTRVLLESGLTVDSSNVYNQPIKLTVPIPHVWDYTNPYTLYHYMPSSIQTNQLQNAIHSTIVTPYFGSTGSIYVSVQNLV
jgi:hypothetical protein